MSGTVGVAAKTALVGTGNVLTGLAGIGDAGVTVAYSMPKDVKREVVYGGKVGGPVTLSAMRGGGSNRIRREEDLTLMLMVRVYKPGQSDGEATETRAVALYTLIAEYIAANSTLGGVTDLKLARVDSYDMESWPDDDGWSAEIAMQIGLKTFLT